MTKEEDSTWLLVAGVLFLLWAARRATGEDTYTVPMPDYTRPEFDPHEVELEPRKTPATFEQMTGAYVRAYRNAMGEAPGNRLLAMLLAQSALETGQWQSMWEWNPANITTSAKRGFFRLKNPDGSVDIAHKYAPYPDAQTGASAHVLLLARKYPRALGAMLADAPETVVHELKAGKFFEADEGPYATTFAQLFNQFLPRLPGPVT